MTFQKYNKNLVHYIVSTCIIHKDGKFLITKRSPKEKAFPNKWTVPGGKLEVLDYILKNKDTSSHWYNVLEELTKREVKEETDLDIKNMDYITSMVYIRPDNIPCLIISLSAEPHSTQISLSEELTEYRWISLEQAKQYDLIEGIYEELEMLEKKLKTGSKAEWKRT